MKRIYSFAALFAISTQLALSAMPRWSYDAGPDPKTKMGKELIDLTAAIPNMPAMSEKLMGEQKFRPAFGPVPDRPRPPKGCTPTTAPIMLRLT